MSIIIIECMTKRTINQPGNCGSHRSAHQNAGFALGRYCSGSTTDDRIQGFNRATNTNADPIHKASFCQIEYFIFINPAIRSHYKIRNRRADCVQTLTRHARNHPSILEEENAITYENNVYKPIDLGNKSAMP